MSSIPKTDGNAYNNPYSSASRRKAEEEAEEQKTSGAEDADSADKTEEAPKTEEETKTLNDYKKDFINRVKTLMLKPHLANVGLELNITDSGFAKMMGDSGYEQSVLDKLNRQIGHSYTPKSGTIKLSADGENEPSATMAESRTVSEILFKTSNRTLLRTLGIDSMIALADETIASRGSGRGRFDIAGQLSSMQMRSANSYLDNYLKSLTSVDTTG